MFAIKLTFCSGKFVELVRVDCSSGSAPCLTCIRGKTSGAYQGVGTFQWSSAVRAVACLFLKAKILDEHLRREPMLSGGSKSLAASLDYALTKQPAWLLDMFGVSAGGKTLAKRLFGVTNSNRKRSGPVAISLNARLCPQSCVSVVLDGKFIESREELTTILNNIETDGWATQSLQQEEDLQSDKRQHCVPLAA